MNQSYKLSLLFVAALGLTVLPACAPRMMRHVGRAALATAVVGTAVVATAAAVHHAHHHNARCGHHRYWHEGRWVYEYEGNHEYYDPHGRRWYRYSAHPRPRHVSHPHHHYYP